MTSAEIRQSFLDFFKSKGHTIVPSASLMPDSPNLLFTNAGMNQFVPIFLGQRAPDVSKWAGAIPGSDTRAADTQKCIRAGGKHNDLEDVGLDTYHHTFFEMLGNWSFGDYFKQEAIEWAWELVTEVWKFPKNRLYATVYSPDKSKGDPSDFDQEAYNVWAEKFRAAGLDPKVHIVNGGKKDNFWMMGDTGPCGPCSELHVDLTPQGDTQGRLVNAGSAECIEIWNLVFIQFNANPDGTFSPLPARHVDTGMGFERVTGIMQNTRNFTDFTRTISNYETDIFRPLFDQIEKLSGKKYGSTLPGGGATVPPAKTSEGETPSDTGGTPAPLVARSEQEKIDVAFRVIGDHIRTLSFAIADGIQPGNTDRNYVLRRILRRAVRYGRTLDFHEPFFYKLVAVVADTMGHVFPEIRAKQEHIEQVIQREEEAFNKTLDNGLRVFENVVEYKRLLSVFLRESQQDMEQLERARRVWVSSGDDSTYDEVRRVANSIYQRATRFNLFLFVNIENRAQAQMLGALKDFAGTVASSFLKTGDPVITQAVTDRFTGWLDEIGKGFAASSRDVTEIDANAAFKLYDTYGFPLDLTELMARERGLTVDKAGFNKLMEEQKTRARAAQKKEVIEIADEKVAWQAPTIFHGFDDLELTCEVLGVDGSVLVTSETPFYPEMGGQVGDRGTVASGPRICRVVDTQRTEGSVILHRTDEPIASKHGDTVTLSVDKVRRNAIQRHHTVTHLLHWALHEVVSKDAAQKGSYVGPEKLTFDFSSAPLTAQQVADVERLVNERILENAPVTWSEAKYADIKSRKDIRQFFGEKYGDVVRVVQIGGKPAALDGYSMELCGGTHTRATGEIGLFRIVGEAAIAAGIRRIEAVSGLEAYKRANEELQLIKAVAGKVNSPVGELEKKIESLLAQQKEFEKQLKGMQQKQAAELARGLAAKAQTIGSTHAIVENLGAADSDFLQSIADALKGQFKGVVVLGGTANNAVALVATVSPDLTKRIQAGKIIQAIAPIVGGKGGGRPDNARGGGKDVGKLDEALAKAKSLLG
jgi:alanyl-tRNA synthetase